MDFKLPVSLCMIVKNEEAFLDVALKSVKNMLGLSDLVVTDTGSTDRTKEIALSNGARVFDFVWCDDFSAARNFSASKAENDWVLYLDADEEITEAEPDSLDALFDNIESTGLLSIVDLSSNTSTYLARLYNRNAYSFEGNIHEQLRSKSGRFNILTKHVNIALAHHGYLPEFDKVHGKLKRNEQLLLKELEMQPDDPYLLYQLGKSYFCNGRDLEKACECFGKVLSNGADINIPYTYDLVECYGYSLLNTGKYETALRLRDTFAEYYDDNPKFRFLSAHIFQNNGMFQEAVDSYKSCIGAATDAISGIDSFLSYFNIGVIFECLGMIDNAVGMYKMCGDYKPAMQRLHDL